MKFKKEFHLFLYDTDEVSANSMNCSLADTMEALRREDDYIYSYDCLSLNIHLNKLGYQVIVHFENFEEQVIKTYDDSTNLLIELLSLESGLLDANSLLN